MNNEKAPTENEPIKKLLQIMARLRAPDGCPWDIKQDHMSIRMHAVEEVYELIDAIEEGDDEEMVEELGDLLLQVVFHAQLADERKAFDFDDVCERIVRKLIRRHPHVFGDAEVDSVEGVRSQWDQIKKEEKEGTAKERTSVFDGVPRHLPALLRTKELIKKGQKAGIKSESESFKGPGKDLFARQLFVLVEYAHAQGWCAETLLREECARVESQWREMETEGNKKE